MAEVKDEEVMGWVQANFYKQKFYEPGTSRSYKNAYEHRLKFIDKFK